jgi:hypothetical protein
MITRKTIALYVLNFRFWIYDGMNKQLFIKATLEKLIATQLVKKFPRFMEPEGSLPCHKEFATVPFLESDVSSQHQLPTQFP